MSMNEITRIDYIGLALDLERRANRSASQTTERSMLAAAHALRMVDINLANHLAASKAHTVDVEAIRWVIGAMQRRQEDKYSELILWSDKLAAALPRE